MTPAEKRAACSQALQQTIEHVGGVGGVLVVFDLAGDAHVGAFLPPNRNDALLHLQGLVTVAEKLGIQLLEQTKGRTS